MSTTQENNIAERAKRLYAERLREMLEASSMNQFVAIEPDSGEYFLGDTLSEAANGCRAKFPDRRPYILRVGHKAAVHLGSGFNAGAN